MPLKCGAGEPCSTDGLRAWSKMHEDVGDSPRLLLASY